MVRVCGGCRITDGGGAGEGDCASGPMVWLLWCPWGICTKCSTLGNPMGPLKWAVDRPLYTQDAWRSMQLPFPQASGLHAGIYTIHWAIPHRNISNWGAPGSPTTNFYIAKIPAPLIFDPDPIGGFQNHRRVVKCGDFHWHLLLFQYHLIACLGSP